MNIKRRYWTRNKWEIIPKIISIISCATLTLIIFICIALFIIFGVLSKFQKTAQHGAEADVAFGLVSSLVCPLAE